VTLVPDDIFSVGVSYDEKYQWGGHKSACW